MMADNKAWLALVVALAATISTGPASAQEGASGRATLELYSPRPYAFCEAHVTSGRGLSGTARLYGIGVDGSRSLLFETKLGYADELAAAYYASPEFLSISFAGEDGDGSAIASTVRLPSSSFGPGAKDDGETATLSALDFPFRLERFGARPSSFSLVDGDPESAAGAAVSRLFTAGRATAPIIALCIWAAAVIAAAAVSKAKRGGVFRPGAAFRLAVMATIAMATAMAVFWLGSTPAELYSIGIRSGERTVTLSVAPGRGYRSVSWDEIGAARSGLRFVAVRSPLSAAVPLSALAEYDRLRFKAPPTVVLGADGTFLLAAAPFAVAWGLHE